MYFPRKLTAGTWKYLQKEKEKHRPKPPIFGFQAVSFQGSTLPETNVAPENRPPQ